MDDSLNSQQKAIAEDILDSFRFLEHDLMYAPEIRKTVSPPLIDEFEVCYRNTVRKREISVGYSGIEINGTMVQGFSVHVTKIPYTTVNDLLSLTTYMEKKGRPCEVNFIGCYNRHSSLEILSNLALALQGELSDLTNGNTWMNSYYPDWT